MRRRHRKFRCREYVSSTVLGLQVMETSRNAAQAWPIDEQHSTSKEAPLSRMNVIAVLVIARRELLQPVQKLPGFIQQVPNLPSLGGPILGEHSMLPGILVAARRA